MTNEEHLRFFDQIKPVSDGAYGYSVCGNCLIALANDDYSGMADSEARATQQGLNHLYAQHTHVVADGAELGFSWRDCECCAGLAGSRFRLICFNALEEVSA